MDSFEVNKIVAAILLVALLVIGIAKISNIVFYIEKPETSGYKVELPESSTNQISQTKNQEEEVDISALLAMGTVAHGETVFKKCSACHTTQKGGKNLIGPALYGVVGRQSASAPDYAYSSALQAYGKKWTFEELNAFLLKPQSYIKGTKMAFAGISKDKDRASVILYMNSQSDSPVPLP